MAGIATAAVLIPLIALCALFCCWRKRKRKEGEFKGGRGPSAAVSSAAGPHGFGREGESVLYMACLGLDSEKGEFCPFFFRAKRVSNVGLDSKGRVTSNFFFFTDTYPSCLCVCERESFVHFKYFLLLGIRGCFIFLFRKRRIRCSVNRRFFSSFFFHRSKTRRRSGTSGRSRRPSRRRSPQIGPAVGA